jgi:hypothetical protein
MSGLVAKRNHLVLTRYPLALILLNPRIVIHSDIYSLVPLAHIVVIVVVVIGVTLKLMKGAVYVWIGIEWSRLRNRAVKV